MRASQRLWPTRWPLSGQIILALALALLPLGVLAVAAAFDNYRDFRASQAVIARVRVESLRRAANATLDQEFAILQALLLAGDASPQVRRDCDRQFTRLAVVDPIIESLERIDSQGSLLCASTGTALPPPQVVSEREGPGRPLVRAVRLDEGSHDRDLVLAVRDFSAASTGDTILARVRRADATRLIDGGALRPGEHVRLQRHGEPVAAWSADEVAGPFGRVEVPSGRDIRRISLDDREWFVGAADVGPGGLRLALARPASPINMSQVLNILLPMVMWLAAVAIGWAAIVWLVVRPLRAMRLGMDRYAADPTTRLAGISARSSDVRMLGAAFDRMADQLDAHEDDLREALATQRKLTREVHHRVKNNLQIVSSLLSLQSRDTKSPEVANAYTAIQKRVNALSLVHRWLFDDEAMRGVDLKSLIHDLCAALEQSVVQSDGINISITPDVERIYVGQDTAVPLAFLITELVTAAVRLNGGTTALRVAARAEGPAAVLSVEAGSFRAPDAFAAGSSDPAARIIQGMARQMRTALTHDADVGRYSIGFPLAPAAD